MAFPRPVDIQAMARGLARTARRRGLAVAQVPAAMVRSVQSLLADHPPLQQALSQLLRRPALMALLAADQPEARALARRDLLSAAAGSAPSALGPWEVAFVDGLEEGWQQQGPAAAREPDLQAWLLGLGVGVLIGGLLAWLSLAAHRMVSMPPPLPPGSLAPVGAAPGGANAPVLPGAPTAGSAASGTQASVPSSCANLAPPKDESLRPAAASNFGKRVAVDAGGAPIPAKPGLIVLHETVLDLPTTIDLFKRNQDGDSAQASYHVLIGRDGQRVRIVADDARAYGAGDSGFGDLRFRTSATNPPSINNIALHVSLESPADGRGDTEAHAGYTPEQYRALTEQVLRWQALYGIPMERVTTHAAVDRSHSRYDPRSFRWDRFDQAYQQALSRCS
jgi:hypothetical protein